jgi:hypothetical protein
MDIVEPVPRPGREVAGTRAKGVSGILVAVTKLLVKRKRAVEEKIS